MTTLCLADWVETQADRDLRMLEASRAGTLKIEVTAWSIAAAESVLKGSTMRGKELQTNPTQSIAPG